MNVRKIPLSLEVAFWNLIISFLTIFRDVRTFTQGTASPMPILRKTSDLNPISNPFRLIISKLKMHRKDLIKSSIRVCFWAMLGFVLGFLYGLLIGY